MERVKMELKDVNLSYGENHVLHDVNLSVMEGEFLTVIGTSGCGKTTLLKLINRLYAPDSGSVRIFGMEETDPVLLRRKIGYAVQGAKLFPHMTLEKNITYVLDLEKGMSREEKKQRVKEMMDLVQLEPELAGRYPGEVSGGQQQRAGIARALAAKPPILLMDEPFGAVDEITRRALQTELLALWRKLGITILFITHDIREALLLGNRTVVMDQGRIVQIGTGEELREHPANDFVRELTGGR